MGYFELIKATCAIENRRERLQMLLALPGREAEAIELYNEKPSLIYR
jgi:hypothetical protein